MQEYSDEILFTDIDVFWLFFFSSLEFVCY